MRAPFLALLALLLVCAPAEAQRRRGRGVAVQVTDVAGGRVYLSPGSEAGIHPGAEIVIGRASDLDMVLVEDMVSRKHAKITTMSGQIVIQVPASPRIAEARWASSVIRARPPPPSMKRQAASIFGPMLPAGN